MEQGFLVCIVDESTERPSLFWNGTSLIESVDDAFFYLDKTGARLVSGQIQALYPEHEVSVIAAKRTIVIV
jgi:hypothetical protein